MTKLFLHAFDVEGLAGVSSWCIPIENLLRGMRMNPNSRPNFAAELQRKLFRRLTRYNAKEKSCAEFRRHHTGKLWAYTVTAKLFERPTEPHATDIGYYGSPKMKGSKNSLHRTLILL